MEPQSEGLSPNFKEEELPGGESPIRIDELLGMIETVEAVPTYTPNRFAQQLRIVTAGGSSVLAVYDANNNSWKTF